MMGRTVEHDADDIREGETVIMTLKDSSILREEDGEQDINEDADALEVGLAAAPHARTRVVVPARAVGCACARRCVLIWVGL